MPSHPIVTLVGRTAFPRLRARSERRLTRWIVAELAESPYVVEYAATFTFAATPAQVWAVLERFETLALTWPWLRELLVDGTGLRQGTVVRGVVAPPLPYQMRLDVVLDDCAPAECINASVHGDLEGSAQIAFDADGSETRADASWTIEMMQPSMRVAARLAPWLLRWGHDRVVAATVNGLRRHLADAPA
jgi:carbon monoxide dehydrogenase subunit G